MIVTFFSYKGGVGRTQLLANLASYLCHYKNRKVLLIDWDFEAPGVDVFFDIDREEIELGILDLFIQFKEKVKAAEDLQEELQQEDLPKISQKHLRSCIKNPEGGKVDLLPASRYDSNYSNKINQFDWFDFYETLHGKYYVEFLKDLLRNPKAFDADIDQYDYIFIDSRTGVSDYSGICNIQLPDLNVFVIAPTHQNFNGCKRIYTNIINAPYVTEGNRDPIIMPILSRLVEGDNTDSATWIANFRETFQKEITNFIKYTLESDAKMEMVGEEEINEFIDKTLLPHKNELAYGETVLFDERKASIESTTIQKQFFEIARFLEDISKPNRKVEGETKDGAFEEEETHDKKEISRSPTQRFRGSGDNVVGDKIILATAKNMPRDLSPFPSSNYFIGRNKELVEMVGPLRKGMKFLSITGLAGIGKTSLALQYVKEFRNTYNFRLWLSLKTDLKEAIVYNNYLIDSLGIQEELSSKDFDNEDKYEIILNHLRKLSGKNLLVIDNLEEEAERLKSIHLGENWSVIVTSRFAGAELKSLGEHLPLGNISEDEGVSLFRKYYSKDKNNELIRRILKLIDYHTLGIEIIAKTAERGRIKLPKLLEIVESGLLKSELSDSISVSSQNQKVSISSFLNEIIDTATFSAFEMKTLKGFSLIEPDFFQYDTLVKIFGIPEEEHFKFSESLNLLTEKGFLLEAKDEFKCHRIVREIINSKFPSSFEDVKPIIEYYKDVSFIDEAKDNPVDKFKYIPALKSIIEVFESSNREEIDELIGNLSKIYLFSGDYNSAKELLLNAMILAEENFGENHPTTVVSYSNLGSVLKDLGEYPEAKRLLEKAMVYAEKSFGEFHPTTAVSYSNLATVLQKLGDYTAAKKLLEKAKVASEQNFGEDDPATTNVYTNLAMVLQDLDDYEGARDLLEQAMISTKKNFGEDHPSTALSYSNLATVLQDLGEFQAAESLLKRALKLDIQNFGEDHTTTALSYSNLALVLQDLGDYEGARDLLEKAVEVTEKNLGEDHPTTAVRYSNLATVLQDLGDYEGAKDLLEKAILSDEKNFGESHPTTAIRYSNLALVLQDLEDFQGAKTLLEKTLASDKQNFGEAHSNTAVTYSNLATVLKDLGDFAGARILLEKATKSNERNFGEDHPTTAVSYSNLALVLTDLKDFSGAQELLVKAYQAFGKSLGTDHPNTEIVKGNLDFIESLIG